MIYKNYSELEGKHAFFSPSQSSWLNWFLDYKEGKMTKEQLYDAIHEAYASKVAKDNKAKNIEMKELGLKKLAYPIKKEINGYYFVMNFEADADAVKELDRKTSLNEDVLRHLIIKEDEE